MEIKLTGLFDGHTRKLDIDRIEYSGLDGHLPEDFPASLTLRSDNKNVWKALASLQHNSQYEVIIRPRQYPGEAHEVVGTVDLSEATPGHPAHVEPIYRRTVVCEILPDGGRRELSRIPSSANAAIDDLGDVLCDRPGEV